VIHRQCQQLERRFSWKLPERVVAPLSWLLTFAAICLGFVLFRANSLSQALAMLGAVVKPVAYASHALPPMLYAVVFSCVLGYFAFVGADRLYHRHPASFSLPLELRLVLYSAAFYIGFLHTAETQSFVYFQF
jgi:D-alanyl-lipoteichoic acid acyltransferase DltB (MBOAT superfamily)